MSGSRKSARIADQVHARNQRKIGFGRVVDDNVMTNIASYADKPLVWNKDTRERYSCTPTNVSYKVLGQPGVACPVEAKFVDDANNLCCSSRVGLNTHQQSLDFFKMLKIIHSQVPVQHMSNYPYNLRRVIQWITSPNNASEVVAAPVGNVVVIGTHHERFLDVFKFAVMSKSLARIIVAQNGGGAGGAGGNLIFNLYNPPQWGPNPHLVLDDRILLLDDMIRATNEAGGVQRVTVSQHIQYPTTLPVPVVRCRSLDYSRVAHADLDDYIALIDTYNNNRWHFTLIDSQHIAVVRENVNVNNRMVELFRAMRAGLNMVNSFHRLLLRTNVPPNMPAALNVPAGFTSINMAQGMFTQLVNALANSVATTGVQEHIVDQEYEIDYTMPGIGDGLLNISHVNDVLDMDVRFYRNPFA